MKILLAEPQKGRDYHTPYPPLGLLKLAGYHKKQKDTIRLVNGFSSDGFEPDTVYITSLFTYAYRSVNDLISYYEEKYRKARTVVGGVYATLYSEHLRKLLKDMGILSHK